MERLYENIFSSLAFLKAFNRQPVPIHTYVLEKDCIPYVVLLFRIEGKGVRVLNESMDISAKEIERFASYIFSHFPDVELVSLNAIRTNSAPVSYPSQRFACLEDIVVQLPASQDEYLASLSKATRKNIKRYLSKIMLELPDLRHQVLVGDEIQEHHVRDIIELNKARMQRKQKVSTYDALESTKLIELAKQCGFIRIMELNGTIIAGEICTRIGKHYFSHLGGHDPAYDEYRLGNLNCYLTICECINRGGKQFHFLWGQYDYKYSLRGMQQELNHVTLYRSHLHLGLNGSKAIRLACQAFTRSTRSYVQNKAKESSIGGRLVGSLLRFVRRLKTPAPVASTGAAHDKRTAIQSPMGRQIGPGQVAVDDIFGLEAVKRQKAANNVSPEVVCSD